MVKRVAVIGAGIAGLSAAWLLREACDVTLYESEPRAGGHADTQAVRLDGVEVPVDTGFIVYNERNYPNLTAFFAALGVATHDSNMSFGVSKHNGAFEYGGGDLKQLFAQPLNFLKPRYLAMLRDILRFNKQAPALLDGTSTQSLGDYLAAQKYSAGFIEDYLLPMGAAIWSASVEGMKAFPARNFVRFFVNHGLLSLSERPQWKTVTGGSRVYVARVMADLGGRARLGAGVRGVRRAAEGGVEVMSADGVELYDDVVFACHADQALALTAEPTAAEREILGATRFQENAAVLHQDVQVMPRRRLAWCSWNYLSAGAVDHANGISLTYWMNLLQGMKTKLPLLVTLNAGIALDPAKVLLRKTYRHPQFDAPAMRAQERLGEIQGCDRLWFAGAWTGWGFHEDGIASAVRVANALGVAGSLADMTAPAWLYAGRVAHLRHSPFRHRFDYRVWMMALDLDRIAEVDVGGWMFGHNRLALVSLRDRDHGRRDGAPLRDYVAAALTQAGLKAAARIVFVFTPRLFGYSFNPIGWYFCYDAAGRLFAVLHQVKNTFGNQIGYVMPVSGEGLIRQAAPKRMHVSPFFDMAGGYRFALTPPENILTVSIQYGTAEQKRLTATIMLKARPFSARSLLRLAVEMPFAPMKVMPAILWEALKIKLRGARFHRMPRLDGEPAHADVIVGDG